MKNANVLALVALLSVIIPLSAFGATAPVITSSTSLHGIVGIPFSETLQAEGGVPPYTWAIQGYLPTGLSFDKSRGTISGTPTMAWWGDVLITLGDSQGQSSVSRFTFGIFYPEDGNSGGSTQGGGGGGGVPPQPFPSITISPSVLPNATVGSEYSFTLTATGGTPPYKWALSQKDWFSISPDGHLTGIPTTTGIYFPNVDVQDSSGLRSSEGLRLTVVAPLPTGPIITAITDAATGQPGPFAPGEIVTIWGTGLGPAQGVTQQPINGHYATDLAGTSVGVGSCVNLQDYVTGWCSAVVLYASDKQVNVILPYEVLPYDAASNAFSQSWSLFQLQYQGKIAVPGNLDVAEPCSGSCGLDPLPYLYTAIRLCPASPHIFTTPNGMAESVNQNGSINTANKPAHRGDIISLYATGEGQTTPVGTDGKLATVPLPRPKFQVTVTIGGQPVQVLYAGAAPGEVAGLMQVNVQIPPLMSFASSTPIPGASVSGGTVYAVSVALTVGSGDYAVSPIANIAVQ